MSVWENLGGIQGKVAAVLIAVFAAGAGTGYFAGRWQALEESIERASIRRAEYRKKGRKGRRGSKRRFINRLESDLGLQADQMKQIRTALRQQHEKMMELRIGMRPQITDILIQARREIRVLLDSDQQRGFDRIIREFDEYSQRRRKRWRKMREMRERHMGSGRP